MILKAYKYFNSKYYYIVKVYDSIQKKYYYDIWTANTAKKNMTDFNNFEKTGYQFKTAKEAQAVILKWSKINYNK